MRNKNLLTICEGAMLVAVAIGLSYLKFPTGAYGGSVSLAMIPLIIFAVRWGIGWGFGAGLVFGTLKFLFAGGTALNWQSMLLDYSIAYAAVGCAGIMRGRKWGLVTGALIGCAARFIIHFISGITIYLEYAEPTFKNIRTSNPWVYSAVYNAYYIVGNLILALVVCAALTVPLEKYISNPRKPGKTRDG